MHKVNVLTFGSENFNTSLEELKGFLKFEITSAFEDLENELNKNYDLLLMHEEYPFDNNETKNLLQKTNIIKILAGNSKIKVPNYFDEKLLLPTSCKYMNELVENSVVKKSFIKNSSINIKGYVLNKNEKKLIKDAIFVTLTEKEIQLLELFSSNNYPIEKDRILNEVWKYAANADTHTVETHIYRLRKKIKSKFSDEKFILNDNSGYFL